METVTNAWTNLCLPGKVYLILALLGVASSLASPQPVNKKGQNMGGNKVTMVIGNILWALIWVWIISMLCNAGWIKTAWVLAIGLPVLVLILLVAFIMGFLFEKAG